MHLDEGTLQEMLHGEVADAIRPEIEQHLAGCGMCRQRLSDCEREEHEIFGLLGELDPPADPPARSVAHRPTATIESRGARFPLWGAAALFLVTVSGALLALPGSPVRQFLRQRVQPAARGDAAAPSPAAPADERTGIVVDPGASLVIAFTAPLVGDTLKVVLISDQRAVLRTPIDAALLTSPGRLTIERSTVPATYELHVPIRALRVVVRVRGTDILLWNGTRMETAVRSDSSGAWLIPLL